MDIFNFSQISLSVLIVVFLLTAGVIGYFGYYLSSFADQIADITGIGEAMAGAVLLGAVTSLSGTVTSVIAAAENYPSLAVSNSIGGIVVQTAFLAVADITYRKANLEHAAASIANLINAVILVILMMELLFISVTPELTIWSFHPGLLLVLLTYFFGLILVSNEEKFPMWKPKKTEETVMDVPSEENKGKNLTVIIWKFAGCAVVVAICGYIVAQAGIAITSKTGLSSSFVGGLFTSASTSLPELVVALTAVRQGALTLALGNILGGNTFDVIMVPLTEIFYRKGSILHDSGSGSQVIIVLAAFVTSILLLGLLDRQKRGFGNIGWESIVVLLSFFAGYLILYLT